MGELKNPSPDLVHKKEVHNPDSTARAPEKDKNKKVKHDEWIRHFGKRQNEEFLELFPRKKNCSKNEGTATKRTTGEMDQKVQSRLRSEI
jgi:hypothetical protein